eukprot:TRINITY_DN16985_c0_g1_i1.p1 TRINITY_DN16985_c0_g1~~TRINITY_DN16985_c0_g1_i1.p1  ORF type:complete len:318 (-),score=27.53 TRINITY_DN16985_c0_g1_i1:457-1410(-)
MRRLHELRKRTQFRFELTASAVELTATDGNLDMFVKAECSRGYVGGTRCFAEANGVCIDKTTKPPILYGMTEVVLEDASSVFQVFDAIASRNTASTGLNDHSSRSHCFVFLSLYTFDPVLEEVRCNRFQFVDLAGSERLNDAHRGMTDWRSGNPGTIEGMVTNYGLMFLSQRVRELALAIKRGGNPEVLVARSFKAQCDPDLLVLLAETLTGSVFTLIVVCVSSALNHASQSISALNFGEVFSRLGVRARGVPMTSLASYQKRAQTLIDTGRGVVDVGGDRYATIRTAKARAGLHLQRMLARLQTQATMNADEVATK